MRILSYWSLALALALAGCEAEREAATGEVTAAEGQTVEVACATCIYSMEGVQGCKLAAKIDGKPFLVSGVDADAHGLGLCTAAKKASVVGTVEGDRFVASTLELK